MDDRRFDRLTRALAIAASRRKALLGAAAIGATALVSSRRSEAQAPAPDVSTLCAGDGQPCVMLTGCCTGFTCVTSAINPNQGFCQSGGTGGVQIAPPLTAANPDGSTTQTAPTRTPRTHKTHTPGSNHTNTNTSTRPAMQLKITALTCYRNEAGTAIPQITVRNTGTEAIRFGNLKTIKNPNFNGGTDGKKTFDITGAGRLKPQRSISFVVQNETIDGSMSSVHFPETFFSTVCNEGVVVTYSNADDTSSLTVQKTCPDLPMGGCTDSVAAAGEKTSSTRKKKRHR